MPTLLLEIGCEELPASACREAQAQVPDLVRTQLGVEASHVYVTPRRIAFVVDELPETATEQLVKGPPAERRDQAAAGFAKRYGITEADLEERDGHLWARVPGEPLRGEPLLDRMRAIVHGLEFGKSMRWDASGHRFARPVRWFCEKLDGETLAGSGTTFGHRFTHGELDIESAQEYANTLRGANVEPDAAERRRLIVEALDALGEWRDPLGKLDEVMFMVESPLVFGSEFDERFLRLPERVIITAMQSHQRYFPLGENRFAVVAAGGEVDVIQPGYTRVLEARLEDAAFTFDRDVEVGINELAGRLGRITFIEGGGTLADKAARLVELVEQLGGDADAREAARLAKADQASELVREFSDLEGFIGAEYARLGGYPTGVSERSPSSICPTERTRRCLRRRPDASCRPPTRSTRSGSRFRLAAARRARGTRTDSGGRPSVSVDLRSRVALPYHTTCCQPTFASSSRSGWKGCWTCPWSTRAPRAAPLRLTSVAWPSGLAFFTLSRPNASL